MKKKTSSENQSHPERRHVVQEALVAYKAPPKKVAPKGPLTKDFVYADFKKIADKAPFTVAEWADILHLSERTLHRYAKDNTAFNGMQVERILHIEKLITLGNSLFGKPGFKNWLHFKPYSLNFQMPMDLLKSYEGIQEVIDLLGRIQHGISA